MVNANIEELKTMVFNLLPSYWHPEMSKVHVYVYEKETYKDLANDYITFEYEYTKLGKVLIGNTAFLAKSSRIYGVGLERECKTLAEAVKFAVENSIR